MRGAGFNNGLSMFSGADAAVAAEDAELDQDDYEGLFDPDRAGDNDEAASGKRGRPDDGDGDGDDDEDQGEIGEEGAHYKVYHTSNEVLRRATQTETYKAALAKGSSNAKRRRKPAHAWCPNGQYDLIRPGRPIGADDPDQLDVLDESMLYLFRHKVLRRSVARRRHHPLCY